MNAHTHTRTRTHTHTRRRYTHAPTRNDKYGRSLHDGTRNTTRQFCRKQTQPICKPTIHPHTRAHNWVWRLWHDHNMTWIIWFVPIWFEPIWSEYYWICMASKRTISIFLWTTGCNNPTPLHTHDTHLHEITHTGQCRFRNQICTHHSAPSKLTAPRSLWSAAPLRATNWRECGGVRFETVSPPCC